MLKLIKEVFSHFFNSNTFQKGAALAYYVAFSFLPTIVILISLASLFFGKQAVSGEIFEQLKDTLGEAAASQVQDLIKSQHVNHTSLLTTVMGFITLALSASGMFSQIHNAFNSVWDIKEKPRSSVLKYFTKHTTAFFTLIISFFLILSSTAINAFLIKHEDYLNIQSELWYLYEHALSVVLMALAFAAMFKFLGDAKVHWKVSLLGGLFTAVLFLLGKVGIGMYIGRSHVSTTFGSASTLALLMLWVYYTSQIIFLGASFIKVVSHKLGLPIVPNTNAVNIQHTEVE